MQQTLNTNQRENPALMPKRQSIKSQNSVTSKTMLTKRSEPNIHLSNRFLNTIPAKTYTSSLILLSPAQHIILACCDRIKSMFTSHHLSQFTTAKWILHFTRLPRGNVARDHDAAFKSCIWGYKEGRYIMDICLQESSSCQVRRYKTSYLDAKLERKHNNGIVWGEGGFFETLSRGVAFGNRITAFWTFEGEFYGLRLWQLPGQFCNCFCYCGFQWLTLESECCKHSVKKDIKRLRVD